MVACVPGRDQIIAGMAHLGLWTSTTDGIVWRRLDSPAAIDNIPTNVVFDSAHPDTLWESGMYGNGVYRTSDGGLSFSALSNAASDTVTVDLSDQYHLMLACAVHERANSVAISVSSGRSWHTVDTIPPGAAFQSNPLIVADNTLVVGAAGGRPGIYRTADGAKTWQHVSDITPDGNWPTSLPLLAAGGVIYWLAPGRGLAKSVDKGATWQLLRAPLTTAPIELPGGTLVGAGSKQLYASRDGGKRWAALGPPAPFAPLGVAYNAIRHTFYVWRFPNARTPSALIKWQMG